LQIRLCHFEVGLRRVGTIATPFYTGDCS
jgi:hypothetical protein